MSSSLMDFFFEKMISFSAKMKGESPKFSGPSYLMNANSNSISQQLSLVEMYNGLITDSIQEGIPNQIVPSKQPYGYLTGQHFFSLRKSVLPPVNNSIMDIFRNRLESRLLLNDHLLSHFVNSFCDQLFETNSNSTNIPAKMDEKSEIKMSSAEIEMSSACKKCDTATLNQELANRKKKEMNKRSKKRRRRQKKSRHRPKADVNHRQSHDVNTTSVTSGICVVSSDNSKFECKLLSSFVSVNSDVDDDSEWETYEVDSPKTSPKCSFLSSFIVPVDGSTDDDDDWDTCATEIFPEVSEFEFTGLFVTSLCTDPSEEDEMLKFKIHLREVNKKWNESSEGLEKKCKLPTKVRFSAEVEVFPVEAIERKGEWETFATERLRFQRRIGEVEKILSPCLHPDHRSKVFQNRLTQSTL